MALTPPDEGSYVWLTVPISEPIEVVVLGDVHSWHTHWYRGPQCRHAMAVRCVREDTGHCDWCRAGYERRVRYVFPVALDGSTRLVELGRVQYPALTLLSQFRTWIGTRLRIDRERPVRNAPIRLRAVGDERIPPEAVVDCAGFVASLGIQQLQMLTAYGVLNDVEHGSNDLPVRKRR